MSLEQAQQYLAKVLPWPQEGDAIPSYVNIHWSLNKLNQHGKPIWTGRATRSVQEAVNTVAWALKNPDTSDIYVCMSSQAEALEKVSKKGAKYLAPIRSQDGVVKLKSIFLDLDAKGADKNSYATLNDAVAALTTFIKTMDLPKPSALVTSGGGIHVYWTFERALTRDEWQPLAFALAEATKRHGLKCDTQCTIDSARILRVPDTFNRKLDVPRPVALAGSRVGHDYSIERIERVLEPYKVAIPAAQQSLLPRRPALQGASELSMGVDRTAAQPVDLNSILPQCAFLADAVTSGGKDLANPLWNLTTLLASFTRGGRADAHSMACGHAGYTKESTDELFERKERERATKGLGWPSCRTISGSGATQCAGCPHFAAGKSPLNLAIKSAPAVAPAAANGPSVLPSAGAAPSQPVHGAQTGHLGVPATYGATLPVGYKRLGNNVVCRIIIAPDGSATDEPICTYPIISGWLQPDPEWIVNFQTVTQVGQVTQLAVPLKEISTKDRLNTAFAMRGIALKDHEVKHVREFFMSWIQELQKHKEAVINSLPFGWSQFANGNIEGFVFGGKKFTPLGVSGASNPDVALARRYRPQGDRQHWIDAAKLITDQRRPQLDAIVASAFAAPLIKFTGEPGIIMSTYSSDSGAGKTTALKVAQAVWADPSRSLQGLSDTKNMTVTKLGQLHALPVYWDELKSEEQYDSFVKLTFELTGGKDKGRLNRNGEIKEGAAFQTMLVSASNASILDYVMKHAKQTKAGLYRTFEYEVTPHKGIGRIDQADASAVRAKLDHSYGNIGIEYAEFLGTNHARIETEVAEVYKRVGHEMKVETEERFWRVMVGTLLQGAIYANMLGFTTMDLDGLKAFLFSVVTGMRTTTANSTVDMKSQANVISVLTQFLNQMRAKNTLVTNIIWRKSGRPTPNAVKAVRDATRLEAVYVQRGLDDKVLRFQSVQFGNWLTKNGYSKFMYQKSLTEMFGAKELQARIAAGTPWAVGSDRLIEIDLAANPVLDFE